jgi:hypothetical protein
MKYMTPIALAITGTIIGEGFGSATTVKQYQGLPYPEIEINQLSTGQQVPRAPIAMNVSSSAVQSNYVRLI